MKKILIIDDDRVILTLLGNMLVRSGYEVFTSPDPLEGLKIVKLKQPDLVITDHEMPGMSGIEVVTELVRAYPGLPVIMLTCHSDVSLTIKAIQAGAYDYLEKPIQPKKILELIRNGLQMADQSQAIQEKITLPVRKNIEDNLLAGKSPVIRDIVKNIGRISMHRMSVLITGESGTGKEQIANLIHYSGITRDFPMVTINCKGVEEEKLQMELFGYSGDIKGNPKLDNPGKLAQVGEGTVFIDEFHLLTVPLQNKIFRLLQEMQFEVPGAVDPQPFHARIIAATSVDPEQLKDEGTLLPELFYRLKVFSIEVPPLRDRLDDMPELVQQMLDKLNRKFSRQVTKVEDGVIALLKRYSWPGNIRELDNALTQAILLSKGEVLEKSLIAEFISSEKVGVASSQVPLKSMADIEKEHIGAVLDAVGWNKNEAAKILDITRPTLNAKIAKYNLAPLLG